MDKQLDPIIGNWYRHLDKGQTFRIVDIDDDRGVIEAQHFDGDLEEIELGQWPELELALAAAPEDWTGPIDDIEQDDLGYSETEMSQKDWRESLNESRADEKEDWEDPRADDERDELDEGSMEEDLLDSDSLQEAGARTRSSEDIADAGEPEETEQ
jgi:hypothetical protein